MNHTAPTASHTFVSRPQKGSPKVSKGSVPGHQELTIQMRTHAQTDDTRKFFPFFLSSSLEARPKGRGIRIRFI